MRLVEIATNFPVVEFNEKKTVFHNKYLEKEMSMVGISVPPFLASKFPGKKIVKLNDDLFQQAFTEIFFKFNMDTSKYKWE